MEEAKEMLGDYKKKAKDAYDADDKAVKFNRRSASGASVAGAGGSVGDRWLWRLIGKVIKLGLGCALVLLAILYVFGEDDAADVARARSAEEQGPTVEHILNEHLTEPEAPVLGSEAASAAAAEEKKAKTSGGLGLLQAVGLTASTQKNEDHKQGAAAVGGRELSLNSNAYARYG